MKKLVLAMAAFAALLTSCGGDKSAKLNPVAQPSWYADSAAYVNQAALLTEMPIWPDNIVLVGDTYIAEGLWREFYKDTTFKNRGIVNTTTEHVLYCIDNIAAGHPAKILLHAGYTDMANGTSPEDAAANIKEAFRRIKAISPETGLYCLGITDSNEECSRLNRILSESAEAEGYTFISLAEQFAGKFKDYSWNENAEHLNGYGYEALAGILAPYFGKEAVNAAIETPAADNHHAKSVSIFSSIPDMTMKIVMLGDGYTEACPWSEILPFPAVISRGCSGDKISDIAGRLDCIGSADPSKVFLMAGGNDLRDKSASVSAVWGDYLSLIKNFKKKYPLAQLYIESILPVNKDNAHGIDSEMFNARAAELNKLLEAGVESNEYFFIDLRKNLVDENGFIAENNTYDGVHLTPDGYFRWATELLRGPRLIIMNNLPDSGQSK